jgi:hypothetical protein
MHKTRLMIICVVALLTSATAQVLSPGEVAEPVPQQLQEKYYEQLKAFAADARAHKFAYPFSFSRTLDVELPQQAALDQRSVSFATFNQQVVLKITGNYFASYSSNAMDFNHRTRQTFLDVVLPLLKLAAPRFDNAEAFQAYAFEISHHVRNKVFGVNNERFENVVYIFPRAAVERLVKANTIEQQQAAVLNSDIYVDGQPFMMWLTGDPPAGQDRPHKLPSVGRSETAHLEQVAATSTIEPTVNPKLLGMKEAPLRIVTAEMLGALAVENQAVLQRLARELNDQAHFVRYAPPAFIRFRNGAYLQLSLTTALDPASAAAASRYKVAALAFDEHIAHLVRPVLAYFPAQADFDGVDFSTTIKFSGGATPESLEFIFPMKALRCYASYDCTGQQLIDASIVLLNDDRIALQLQSAEK